MEAQISNLLTEKFAEEEFSDCFLIEIRLNPGNKLEVYMDSDTGVTFDKCQKISRFLEAHLDEKGWLGEKYVLEVSSPGVSRPLKIPRQYTKHIGRRLKVSLLNGELKEGLLEAVGADHISLQEEVTEKEGKKKKKMIRTIVIPFADIKNSVVKVSF